MTLVKNCSELYECIPIEVKNNHTKSKSLDSFNKDFNPPFSIKFSNKRGDVGASLRHYPIYLTGASLRQNLRAGL